MPQTESDIRSRLLVARLPAMPQILLKLIEHCQSEDVGMAALAELIGKDPGMTGKILGVANSSAYHRSGRNVGLEQALTALGTDMIKTLVINASVFQVFNNFSASKSTDLRGFWHHSLSAGVMARDIAERMGYLRLEEAYLAGLLHDVGRLALLATAPGDYADSFQLRDDDALCAIEQTSLNITHAEAGAWLVEHWNLDSFLADSVLYHHEPAARLESAHPLIRIAHLAHQLCNHDETEPSVQAAGQLCGLETTDLALIRSASDAKIRTSAAYLGIDLAGFDSLSIPRACAPDAPMQDPVQRQLAEEVRNLVLVSEATRSFSQQPRESEWLESVTRSARILFDFEGVVILLMNGKGDALVGAPVGSFQDRLKEFTVALGGNGVIAAALRAKQVAFIPHIASPLGIAEEQLLRILGTQSLVCVPLGSRARYFGAMIGGLSAWQVPDLQRRENLLRSFGAQAATALTQSLDARAEASLRVAAVAEDYRAVSRRVVHEVNNPLAIIKNYLSVLECKLETREPIAGEISILNEEIDRVGRIIKGLTDPTPKKRDAGAEITRVVHEVARLFRGTDYVSTSLKIVAPTQDQPVEVECDADSLKQILVNLVKNAFEAIPADGEIQIVNTGYVNRDGRLYAELCVKDNGPGMSPEMLAQLFSPGHSTKGGSHQGLGLSIVHKLVIQAQGLITCRSSKKGTAFEILLPIGQRRAAATSQSGA